MSYLLRSVPASLIRDKCSVPKGTHRPIRKILPIIVKKGRPPNFDEEADLWYNVVACDDTDTESDMPHITPPGIASVSVHGDSLGCCGEPSALLMSKSTVNGYDPDAGKLWDPSQDELRGHDGAIEGSLQSMAA